MSLMPTLCVVPQQESRTADLFQLNGDCLGIQWGTWKGMEARLLIFSWWSRVYNLVRKPFSLLEIILMTSLEGQKTHEVYLTRGFSVESRLVLKKVVHHPTSFPQPEEQIYTSKPKLPRTLRTTTLLEWKPLKPGTRKCSLLPSTHLVKSDLRQFLIAHSRLHKTHLEQTS